MVSVLQLYADYISENLPLNVTRSTAGVVVIPLSNGTAIKIDAFEFAHDGRLTMYATGHSNYYIYVQDPDSFDQLIETIREWVARLDSPLKTQPSS